MERPWSSKNGALGNHWFGWLFGFLGYIIHGSFETSGAPIFEAPPNNRALATQRTPNSWKQPCLRCFGFPGEVNEKIIFEGPATRVASALPFCLQHRPGHTWQKVLVLPDCRSRHEAGISPCCKAVRQTRLAGPSVSKLLHCYMSLHGSG